MDIFVNRASSASEKKEEQRPPCRQEKRRDRRKGGKDRRRSVNEGVVVSLSVRNERRSYRERRQQHPIETEFHFPGAAEKDRRKRSISIKA